MGARQAYPDKAREMSQLVRERMTSQLVRARMTSQLVGASLTSPDKTVRATAQKNPAHLMKELVSVEKLITVILMWKIRVKTMRIKGARTARPYKGRLVLKKQTMMGLVKLAHTTKMGLVKLTHTMKSQKRTRLRQV